MENEVAGGNIGQDAVDSGVEGNFEVGVNSDIFVLIKLNHYVKIEAR